MKLVTSVLAALSLCSIDLGGALPDGFEDESLGKLSSRPTDIAFTPQGEMLVVEKDGIMTVFESPGGDFSYSQSSVSLDISNKVCNNIEQGLISVALHPDFEQNRFIFLYYTYNKGTVCSGDVANGPVNRLSRFFLTENNVVDEDSEEVWFETPRLDSGTHTGGKIQFGNDGHLYVTVGDGGNGDRAQDPQNLFGSVLRLTADNGIPDGNPYAQEANSVRCNERGEVPSGSGGNAKCQEIFAMGLRNPWRLAMNPNVEEVYFRVQDVGARTWEEISEGGDRFVGANYGYPAREGPCKKGEVSGCAVGYLDYDHPIHYTLHTGEVGSSSAVTGGAFVPTGIWPEEYDGEYLFADFVLETIYLLKDSGRDECIECSPPVSKMDMTVFHTPGKTMALQFGPFIGGQMALYYTLRTGEVRRVYFGDLPDAVIDVSERAVEVGSAVAFSGARSTDPDGNTLSYEWDFDGNGVIDSFTMEASYAYNAPGLYQARLNVRNINGGVGSDTVTINVVPPAGSTPEISPAYEVFPWSTDCPEGYDFCGMLEFCQEGDVCGYRLPCLEEECECLEFFAPLIRLVPGNVYQLTLRNDGSEVTNLHTHGLHIVGNGNSDDVTREISGGGNCLDYKWDISADHPGGTYWYHAHHHGLAEKQVGAGAYGLLIVEDNDLLNPVLPSWADNERLLQVVLTPSGQLIGNGKTQEVIDISANQWYRLRVSLVSTTGVPSNFTFDDEGTCEIHKVAADGIWRSSVPGPRASSFGMTGVSRADFAIRCSTEGSLVPIFFVDQFAATLRVGPSESNPFIMEDWQPNRPEAIKDLSGLTVLDDNKFSVSLGYDHVNNLHWDPFEALAEIAYNEVHEWTLVGTDFHPFHIHLYHMQVVTPGGCGFHEEGEFYDTISATEDCTVRFVTADFGQRCVLHCHVLLHEDNGSMGWVNVTGENMPRNDIQSMEYSCPKDTLVAPAPATPPPATPPPTASSTVVPATPAPIPATALPATPPTPDPVPATNAPAPPPAPTEVVDTLVPTLTTSSAAALSKGLSVLALVFVNWCLV